MYKSFLKFSSRFSEVLPLGITPSPSTSNGNNEISPSSLSKDLFFFSCTNSIINCSLALLLLSKGLKFNQFLDKEIFVP